ncbi:hypothetical protein Tco_0834877 [Tanacetum coccineum]
MIHLNLDHHDNTSAPLTPPKPTDVKIRLEADYGREKKTLMCSKQRGLFQLRRRGYAVTSQPFHDVKVSVISEPTQIPPSTPPASLLPATITPAVPVPIPKSFNDVVQRVSNLEKDVKELKQVDHIIAILESINSEVPEAINKYLGSTLGDSLQKVKQERVAQEKIPKYSTTPYDQAAEDEHKQKEILFQMMMASKKRRHDDKDQDPSTGSNQRKKRRRTRKDVEPSKKSSTSKESAKGKTPSSTSKSSKSVSVYKSIHKSEHIVQMDIEEPNLKNVAIDADEPQADDILKIDMCTDKAKIPRKRLKPGKHEHGNGRARKKPGGSYQSQKVNSQSNVVNSQRKSKGMESRNVVAYCYDEKYYEPVNCEHDKCVSYCMKLHGEDYMSAECLLVDDITLDMDYCQLLGDIAVSMQILQGVVVVRFDLDILGCSDTSVLLKQCNFRREIVEQLEVYFPEVYSSKVKGTYMWRFSYGFHDEQQLHKGDGF